MYMSFSEVITFWHTLQTAKHIYVTDKGKFRITYNLQDMIVFVIPKERKEQLIATSKKYKLFIHLSEWLVF